MWDAKQKAAEVLRHMIPVTEKRVKGAHDAQMVIARGKAYIVYEANDVRAGENGEWPFVYCAMSVMDVAQNRLLRVEEIARPGKAFANVTLKTGACFVPRILQKDEDTLRVFFVSMEPGVRQAEMWYVDYHMAEEAFDSRIYPVMLKTKAGTLPMTPHHFWQQAHEEGFNKREPDSGLYLFDVDKPIGGRRYVALNNFLAQQNALGVFNDALDTVELLGNFNEPQTDGLSESAVHMTPEGEWLAIIRCDNGNQNYRFATSPDGRVWSPGAEKPAVQNGSNSKPILEKFGGVYFMGWQEKPFRTRFNIDLSADAKNWVRAFSFDDEEFSLQYPDLYLWEGTVYICGTHGRVGGGPDGRDSIWFGPLAAVEEAQKLVADNRKEN